MQSRRQAAGAAQQVGEGAKDDATEADEDEWGAEEAHGAAGEVEEMGKGEVVVAALREEGRDVGVGIGVGRGDGEEERDGGEERAERAEKPAVSDEGAARGGAGGVAVGAGEEATGHQREGGQRVVLLARGEGEEDEDEAGPEEEGEGGFAVDPTHVAMRPRHGWGTR